MEFDLSALSRKDGARLLILLSEHRERLRVEKKKKEVLDEAVD